MVHVPDYRGIFSNEKTKRLPQKDAEVPAVELEPSQDISRRHQHKEVLD